MTILISNGKTIRTQKYLLQFEKKKINEICNNNFDICNNHEREKKENNKSWENGYEKVSEECSNWRRKNRQRKKKMVCII